MIHLVVLSIQSRSKFTEFLCYDYNAFTKLISEKKNTLCNVYDFVPVVLAPQNEAWVTYYKPKRHVVRRVCNRKEHVENVGVVCSLLE